MSSLKLFETCLYHIIKISLELIIKRNEINQNQNWIKVEYSSNAVHNGRYISDWCWLKDYLPVVVRFGAGCGRNCIIYDFLLGFLDGHSPRSERWHPPASQFERFQHTQYWRLFPLIQKLYLMDFARFPVSDELHFWLKCALFMCIIIASLFTLTGFCLTVSWHRQRKVKIRFDLISFINDWERERERDIDALPFHLRMDITRHRTWIENYYHCKSGQSNHLLQENFVWFINDLKTSV